MTKTQPALCGLDRHSVTLSLVVALACSTASRAEDPDWMLGPSLGIGAVDVPGTSIGKVNLSLSLDAKHRWASSDWVGLSTSMHGFLGYSSGNLNSPHEFYTATPTYSRFWMGRFAHLGITGGLGVYWLRENTNLTSCEGTRSRGFGGPGSQEDCLDLPEPPDIWKNHVGLMAPLSLRLGVHYRFLGLHLQPEVGGLAPLTDRPSLGYWVHYRIGAVLLF